MTRNAAQYENPSAGRFDPPPATPTPRESRARGLRLFTAMVVLALLAARWLLPSPGGWVAYLFVALAVAATILDGVLVKQQSDEKGPYTDRGNITR